MLVGMYPQIRAGPDPEGFLQNMTVASRVPTVRPCGRWLGWCFNQGPQSIRLTNRDMMDQCTYVGKILRDLAGVCSAFDLLADLQAI